MHIRSSQVASHLIRAAVITGLVVTASGLSGCSYLRRKAGITAQAPDEFAVLTKGSLEIPPDFGLMPPKPGEPPTNQTDPSTSAEAALYGDEQQDAAQVAATIQSNGSEGEKLLLAKAGAANADPEIRQHLAADVQNVMAANDSFVNEILLWKDTPKDKGTPVDAKAESARLAKEKQTGEKIPPQKEEDSGWFAGWFDWL